MRNTPTHPGVWQRRRHACLARAVDLRPGEAAPLRLGFAMFLRLLAGYTLLRPLRDAMGLVGGGGGLLRRVSAKPLPAWAAEIGATSWAQVLLKFILAHPAVTCPIPGTGTPAQMADNARAADGRHPDATLRRRMIAEVGA